MLPYQFNKIYSQQTGEYENGLRMLFVPDTGNDILVYEVGAFCIVNKPLQLNLNGYSSGSLNTKKSASYKVLQISHHWRDNYTYLKLEDAIIKIAWAFSTQDGQQVESYFYCNEVQANETYQKWLNEFSHAYPVDISDLRFI